MNPGGVRADLLFHQISGGERPGQVTYGEAFNVQPFNNTLVVKTCTGQQISTCSTSSSTTRRPSRTVMLPSANADVHLRRRPPPGVDGTSCATAPQPVSNVRSTAPLSTRTRRYRVTMNNFMADGGDGYTVAAGRARTARSAGEFDLDSFARYLEPSLEPVRRPRRRPNRITTVARRSTAAGEASALPAAAPSATIRRA